MSATTAYSTTAPDVTKRIAYNRDSKDYDCFVTVEDEELYIGSAPNYSAAETKCRDYAYDYYADNHTYDKAAEIALVDALPDASPLHTVTIWEDRNGDLTDEPTDTIAGTEYHLSDEESAVAVSLYTTRNAEVYQLGRWTSVDTIDDIEQAARNLLTLLTHPVVVAARVRQAGGAPPKPTPLAPTVRIERGTIEGHSWTDFCCGEVIVEVPDAPDEGIFIHNLGGDQQPIADAVRNMTDLNTILSDPRFQAARAKQAA